MKKLLLILLTLFVYSEICTAQAPNWLWGEAGTGGGFGYCSGMAFGPLDTIYIAGRTGSSITIGGKSYNTGGGTYPYIGKLDTTFLAAPNTNGIWVNGGLNTGFDYGYDICSDNLGYLYNTGDENSGGSIYVVKFSHGGNPIHVNNTGTSNGQGYGVTADAFENVYVTGNYSGGTTQFGNTGVFPSAGSSWGGFVTKYDSVLSPIWSAYFYAADNYVTGKGVATDLQGNVYVVGSYTGPCVFYSAYGNATTFSPPNYAPTGTDGNLFVAKYDSAGVIQWVQGVANAGLPNNDWGGRNRIVVDSCGNVYVGGIYDGTAQFGTLPPVSHIGTYDNMFVAKYNTKSMAWEWVETGGGTVGATGVNQLALDKTSNVYAVGYMDNSTFNDTTLSSGNFFLAKYSNSNGDLDWIQSATIMGQSATLDGVAIDGQNYCYVVGTSSGPNSYLGTFNLPNSPGGSVFIAKMDTIPPRYIVPTVDTIYCSGTGTISFNVVGTFTAGNIFTAQLSDSSGSFANAVNIGSDTTTTGGTINITIPPGTPAGNTYLIRIVSSTPPTSSLVNGCGAYYSQGIYVNDYFVTIGNNLVSSLVPDTATICTGGAVLLTANGGAGAAYLWSNGATTDTISVNPTQDTTYTVMVSRGSCSNVDTAKIKVKTALPLITLPQSPSVCNGLSITIVADTTGSNYIWSPGTGLSATTGDSVLADPTITVIYTITGTNSAGCAVTGTDTVKYNATATIPVYPPGGASICSGQSVTLKAPTSGSGYVWTPSTGLLTTTGDSVVASPTVDITYTVTGIDSLGCTSTGTESVLVSQGPNQPVISPSVTGDTLFSSANYGNQWYNNGKLISGATGTLLVVTGLPVGDSITVSVTDVANGCSTTSAVYVTGINLLTVINDEISIYPNPTNGFININISTSAGVVSDWNLQLTDVLGRTLYTRASLNYKNEIDLSNLPGGVYFITVINNTDRAVFPVVKQN